MIAVAAPIDNTWLNTKTPTILLGFTDPDIIQGVQGSGVDVSSISILLDGIEKGPPQSAIPNTAFLITPSLSEGDHELRITATDKVGNLSAMVVRHFHVDTQAPSGSVMAPPQGAYISGSTVPKLEAAIYDAGGLSADSIHLNLDGSSVPAIITLGGSAGAPAQWKNTTPITYGGNPYPIAQHAVVVYNGYMYVIGGNKSDYSYSDRVAYAKILEDGTLDAWKNGPSMPAVMQGNRAVGNKGRLYVLGNAISTGNKKVYSSTVSADGSLGTWTSLPDMPAGYNYFGVVVINDYIYVMGSGSAVFYAQICDATLLCRPSGGAGGSGPWAQGTSLPYGLTMFHAVNAAGTVYIYVPGGYSSTFEKRVLYNAPVQNGALGAWEVVGELPKAVENPVVLAAYDKIYVIGGDLGPLPAPGVISSATYIAQVFSNHTLGAWVDESKNYLPKGLYMHGGGVWNGRLYIAGGFTRPTAGHTAEVFYSDIQVGTLKSATATYTLAGSLSEGEHAVAITGQDLAGNPGGSAPTSFYVDNHAPLLSMTIDGSVCLSTALSHARSMRPSLMIGYVDPPIGSLPGSGVDQTTLKLKLDGTLLSLSGGPDSALYQPASDLAQGLHAVDLSIQDRAGNLASAHIEFDVDSVPPAVAISTPPDGTAYAIRPPQITATYSDLGSGLSTQTIRLQANGTDLAFQLAQTGGGEALAPKAWVAASSITDNGTPFPIAQHATVVHNGYMYIIGGNKTNYSYSNKVLCAKIEASGKLISWFNGPNLPVATQGNRAVGYQDKLFTLSGTGGSQVYFSRIDPNTGGPIGWTPSNILPVSDSFFGLVEMNGYLYVMGGQLSSTVYYSRICDTPTSLCAPRSGGPVWDTTVSLPYGLGAFNAVGADGKLYIYIPGGHSSAYEKRVLYNEPDPNTGALISTWPVVSWLPQGVENPVVLAARDKIYVIGGDLGPDPAPGVISSAVYFTHVNADHTLGPWVNERDYYLPNPVYMHGGGVWNGRLYIAGGYTSPSGGHTAGVFSAEVAGDAVVSATATYLVPPDIPEGAYTAMASADDLAGNHGSATSYFALDFTPPVSTPTVMGPGRFFGESGKYYVASGGLLQITAEDPVRGVGGGTATGVKERWLKDSEEPYAQTSGPFRLSDGEHALKFYGVDNVGNVELDTKTASVVFDSTAPGSVELTLVSASTGTLTVAWNSPGDNDAAGDILDAEFRIQFSSESIEYSTQAAQIVIQVANVAPYTPFSQPLTGLSEATTYYAALFARDTAGNWSQASNILAARTQTVAGSTDSVVELLSYQPGVSVVVVDTHTQVSTPVYTTALEQGYETLTQFYDIDAGTGTIVFDPPAILSFIFILPDGVELGDISIYQYDSQTDLWISSPIANQQIALIEGSTYKITGELAHASLYTVLVRVDNLPPRTVLSLGQPNFIGDMTYISSTTAMMLTAFDDRKIVGDGLGTGVVQTLVSVDTAAFSAYAPPLEIADPGLHLLRYYSIDKTGNPESIQSAQFIVDSAAPMAALSSDQALIEGPEGYTVMSPTATITLSAEDPLVADVRSGLGAAEYELDGAVTAFQLTPGDASVQAIKLLGAGQHAVTVRASDRLGNAVAKTWHLTLIGDAVPPLAAIASPCSGAAGVCRIYEGLVKVMGTATDAELRSWKLESGTVLVASGTYSVFGLLGVWDTAGLSGYKTLNLTAEDASGNTASASVEVFIGDPARTLVLGSKKTFNHPHAVAAKAGKLYVADTNADRIALFGEDGAFRGSYGNKTTVEPYFDKPKAVDADEAGNIYVADTQHHRIVKLSAEGGFLFEIGDVQTGKNGKKSFRSGKENGQFKHPSGIALDPGGSIYVSDTGNRRIQVFNAQGVFQRVFTIPDTDQTLDPDAEDKDEFAPIGLDVDAAGNVLIADSKGRRALVFSQDGQLKQTLSGMFKRPEGIAVSPDESCILVSDRKLDKVFKFDFKGAQTLEFGEHGEIKDGKPLPSELVFNKPIGLALSDSGTLYVADRNNERIQGFGLPVEQILIASGETGGNTYRAASTGEVAKTVETKFARSTLLKETGGTIIREDKAAVVIPPDALPEDSELTIEQATENPKRRDILTKNRLAEASEAVEFGPDGTRFTTPVTITLPYLAQGVAEDKLKIHYWNPEKEEWEALDSTIDKENKLISAKTTHFSLYQVLAPSADMRAAADPEAAFTFRELYVFPNPARAGAKPTIHLAVGKADQVIIRIYNVAGQQVHEASLDSAPQVINMQYAYEYAWDGHIPSGVYFYVVEAKKGGQGSIRRTGKMAVVR